MTGQELFGVWQSWFPDGYFRWTWEGIGPVGQQAWDKLADHLKGGVPSVPQERIALQKIGFNPVDYSVVRIVDTAIHHRTCALRVGGTECTCA